MGITGLSTLQGERNSGALSFTSSMLMTRVAETERIPHGYMQDSQGTLWTSPFLSTMVISHAIFNIFNMVTCWTHKVRYGRALFFSTMVISHAIFNIFNMVTCWTHKVRYGRARFFLVQW